LKGELERIEELALPSVMAYLMNLPN